MSDELNKQEKGKWAEEGEAYLGPDWFDTINHETKIVLCHVDGDGLGNIRYFFYVEDPHNLGRSIGFIMGIGSDGKIEFELTDPDGMLMLTNPEHDSGSPPLIDEQLTQVLNLYAQRVNRS